MIGVLTNDMNAFHGPEWKDGLSVIKQFDFIVDGSITGFLVGFAPWIVTNVVGAGHGEKAQIRMMIGVLLPKADPQSEDAADALAIAVTHAPGLVGALLVGAGVARSLAWALDVPAIGVHHMEGHLLAPLLEAEFPSARYASLGVMVREFLAKKGFVVKG